MAARVELLNRMDSRVGAVRALASEDVAKGDVVCISGANTGPIISLADCQHKSKGLLLVALTTVKSGGNGRFCQYMIAPLTEKAKVGDPVFLGKKGKWTLKKLKTGVQIGIVISGKEDDLNVLIAPQGRY